jgi:hypothetical protein
MKDIGTRYSIYKINPLYQSDHLQLANPEAGTLHYKKTGSEEYEVSIDHLVTNTSLSFFEPFNKDWVLTIGDKDYKRGENTVLYDYANSWIIDKTSIEKTYSDAILINDDESIDFTLHVSFVPKRYTRWVYGISAISFLAIILFLLFSKRSIIKK